MYTNHSFILRCSTNGSSSDPVEEKEYERILKNQNIENDDEMCIVMNALRNELILANDDPVKLLVDQYYLEANKRKIRVLTLDGGGVRGYIPIKILIELINQQYLSDAQNLISNNLKYKKSFQELQLEFTKNFDYFVGTSIGGLIAFCLAIGYNILDIQEIYSNFKYYFKRNYLRQLISSKYNPCRIHKKIDKIINSIKFPGNKNISSEHATLLDIRNLLNPNNIINEEEAKLYIHEQRNLLEFVNNNVKDTTNVDNEKENNLRRIKREKVLLITTYNITTKTIMIFNTSNSKHWGYRIADVLKATIATPNYFPPQKIFKGIQCNGYFLSENTSELFNDSSIIENHPEIAALQTIRMQWNKPGNYSIMSIGTNCYTPTSSLFNWGGYMGWIFNKKLLVNILNGAHHSTDRIGWNLTKFDNVNEMKLDYQITPQMTSNNRKFIKIFDKKWEQLKNESNFKAFINFYENYIIGNS